MRHSPVRRALLLTAAALPFTVISPSWARGTSAPTAPTISDRLATLESSTDGGRLGVSALNTADGVQVNHRGDERFPFCSTFKVLVTAAILKRSMSESDLLQRRITYKRDELVTYSPITEKHIDDGMTVSELYAATLQYGDNTAANLLMKILGGPPAVTAFARSIGDDKFQLDRWETELNTAIPNDPRDTSTPIAMMKTLQQLVLGDILNVAERDKLVEGMLNNTTGATRIRAGVPKEWRVADRTGAGEYGTTNAIGVVWPTGKLPIVLAIYFTQRDKNAPWRHDVVASAARIVAETFG